MTTFNLTILINLMIVKNPMRLQRSLISQMRKVNSQRKRKRKRRKKARRKIRMKKINLIKTKKKERKTQRRKVNKINLIKTIIKTKILSHRTLTHRPRMAVPKIPTKRTKMETKNKSNPRTAKARMRRRKSETNTAL